MPGKMVYNDRDAFLEGLRTVVRDGVPPDRIRTITPFDVPEAGRILSRGRSKVRFFALLGAASGTATGFAFTILTSLSWPLIVGGKPIVSIPPFVIIAFALTILFGALSTFAGFLLLTGLPSPRAIRSDEDPGNRFVILVDEEEPR